MSTTDKHYLETQQTGYRDGEAFDPEVNYIVPGLAKALKDNGLFTSDMRQYAYAVGFLNACVNTLKTRLAEARGKGQVAK